MKLTKLLTAPFLVVSLLTPSATAQMTTAPTAAVKSDEPTAAREAAAALERKALAVLAEVIADSPSLKLVENRVRLQALAAEVLWPHDPERAREIFNSATSDLAALTGSIEPDDPQYHNLSNMTLQLRQRVLSAVAPRDPKLALHFLRSTRLPPPPVQPGDNYKQPDQELMLESQLAQHIAQSDPQQALRIAEESLSRGVSSSLMQVLDQLRTRDAAGAARLSTNIAKKIRTANFAIDHEATYIASHLLQSTRPPERPPANGQTSNLVELPDPRRLHLDEATRRELASQFVNAVLNASANPGRSGNYHGLLSTIRQLMPEVEHYLPAQAAAVRRKIADFERNVDSGPSQKYREVMNAGTPDAILEAAEKAPPEIRNQLFHTAAWKAFNENNAERARQIINTHIENSQQREQMLKEFDKQLFWRVASQGNVEQARQFLDRVKSIDERVGMLVHLASVVASGKGNRQGAEQLLDEAWNLIGGGRARNHAQLSMQLQLSQHYVPVAPARSFEIVEASITHLNELIAAAAVINGFGQDSFAEDELKGQEGYVWTALATQCSDILAALARVDFADALSAADKFQRPELRLQARLAVVHAVLMKDKERKDVNRRTFHRGG
ncbi:MAG: hypothetical protein ACR2G4_01980 [Pyrinomonadaceae bacterium]